MGFGEPLKLKVKKKAHFHCCLCKAVGVEIHHILPQEEGGPDTIDNAAPYALRAMKYMVQIRRSVNLFERLEISGMKSVLRDFNQIPRFFRKCVRVFWMVSQKKIWLLSRMKS